MMECIQLIYSILTGEQKSAPLCIWLPQEFPMDPPLVYIFPTQEFSFSSTSYVDAGGKITLPYLEKWKDVCNENMVLSTLAELLKHVIGQQCAFNKDDEKQRNKSFSFTLGNSPKAITHSFGGFSSSKHKSVSMQVPLCFSDYSNSGHRLEMVQMKSDMEKKEKELYSYRRTIEALTKELNQLGDRVHELEKIKHEKTSLRLMEDQGKTKDYLEDIKETKRELKDVKEVNTMYQDLLEVQAEKV